MTQSGTGKSSHAFDLSSPPDERREFFGRAYDLLGVGHLIASTKGELLCVNPGLATMLGYATQKDLTMECEGRAAALWEEPGDCEAFASLLMNRGSLARYPAVLRRRGGSFLPCMAWGRLVEWPGVEGQVVEVMLQSQAESHQAFAALTQVLSLYRDMMDLNPDPVLIHQNGRVLLANPAAEAFFRSPGRGSLVGRTTSDLFDPRSASRVSRRIREASQNRPQAGEYRVVLATGEERWVRDFNAPVTYHGRPATLTLLHDRTERRRAESYCHLIAQSLPDPAFIHHDDVIYYANPAAERFFGLAESEALAGKRLSGLLPGYSQARSLSSLSPSEEEYTIRLTGGYLRLILARSVRVGGRGHPITLTVLHDHTDRLAAEQARAEAEALYQTLVENSPNPVFIHDLSGLKQTNEAGARFFRLGGVAELMGKSIEELVDAQSATRLRARVLAMYEGKGDVASVGELRLRSGEVVHQDAVSLPITYQGRRCLLTVVRDLSEIHAAEQARAEAERLYRDLLEHLPAAVFLHSGERVIYANPACRRMFAQGDGADLRGRYLAEFLHADSLPTLARRRAEALASQGVSGGEYPLRAADGRLLHVAELTVPVEVGGRGAFLAILQDVTGKVQAEQAHAEAESLYRTLVETMPDPLFIHESGVILYANPAAVAFLGCSGPQACLGKTLQELLPPESHAVLAARLRTIRAFPGRSEAEYPLTMPGGEVRHILARSVGVEYRGWPATVVLFHDLTMRKQAEAERDQALARHDDLFQSAPLGIILGRPDRRLVRVNRRVAQMFGYPSPEAMMTEVEDIATQLFTDPEDYWRLRRLLEHQGEVEDFECLARRRDGAAFWTSRSIRVVLGPGGNVTGFEAFVRDITARRAAQEEAAEHGRRVQALAAELSMASERERRGMARDLHDGPVQLIGLAAMMLEDLSFRSGNPREIDNSLALLREAADMLRTTLDDLAPPALFAAGLGEALGYLGREFLERYGLEVAVTCPPLPGLTREANAFLYRAVREFLVNAVKHGRAGRALVRVEERAGVLALTVEDDGRGFALERLDDSERFSMGLPGLRSMARDLGGGLAVVSTPGKGTLVELELPLAPLSSGGGLPR